MYLKPTNLDIPDSRRDPNDGPAKDAARAHGLVQGASGAGSHLRKVNDDGPEANLERVEDEVCLAAMEAHATANMLRQELVADDEE